MLKVLNDVIDFIDARLTDDLSLNEISQYAGISAFNLSMVFFSISGMTLSEYIRNRKLSEANKDLLEGSKVTDIAYKYGYQSIDGFTRAFKKWCGYLPSEASKNRISKYSPKLTFVITVKGGNSMEFRIIDKPAFNLAGVSRRVPMQFEGVNNDIVKLAQSITEEQRKEMHLLKNVDPMEIVNASYNADFDFLKDEGYLTHLIGVLTSEDTVSGGLEKVPVDACTWAVFPNEGPFPSTLQDTMARIYSEWLPASNYEVLNAPTFSFTKMDKEKEAYAFCEIWIPVRKV